MIKEGNKRFIEAIRGDGRVEIPKKWLYQENDTLCEIPYLFTIRKFVIGKDLVAFHLTSHVKS